MIPSPPANGLHVGPLFVHAYGVGYALALVAAIRIAARRWQRADGQRALVEEVAVVAFPAGLVGARLYFLATSWNEVPGAWWGPVAVWKGGLSIWGGIAAGTVAGLVVLHRRHADTRAFMDAAAPALLVAQAIGRVGNYFNQELFGRPTSLPWGLRIDLAHRPEAYKAFTTFHPTFLYELLWDLALAGALVLLGRSGRLRPGGLFALYVAGYSFARIGEELLRVDPAHMVFGLRLNFFVAAAGTLAGLAWFARLQWPRGVRLRASAGAGGGALLVTAGAVALCGCGAGRLAAGPRAAAGSTATATRPAQVLVSAPASPATPARGRAGRPGPGP